jgi:hypothetical protein
MLSIIPDQYTPKPFVSAVLEISPSKDFTGCHAITLLKNIDGKYTIIDDQNAILSLQDYYESKKERLYEITIRDIDELTAIELNNYLHGTCNIDATTGLARRMTRFTINFDDNFLKVDQFMYKTMGDAVEEVRTKMLNEVTVLEDNIKKTAVESASKLINKGISKGLAKITAKASKLIKDPAAKKIIESIAAKTSEVLNDPLTKELVNDVVKNTKQEIQKNVESLTKDASEQVEPALTGGVNEIVEECTDKCLDRALTQAISQTEQEYQTGGNLYWFFFDRRSLTILFVTFCFIVLIAILVSLIKKEKYDIGALHTLRKGGTFIRDHSRKMFK